MVITLFFCTFLLQFVGTEDAAKMVKFFPNPVIFVCSVSGTTCTKDAAFEVVMGAIKKRRRRPLVTAAGQ